MCQYVTTYLMVSEGVTANTASVIPAPRPAANESELAFDLTRCRTRYIPTRLRGALSLPYKETTIRYLYTDLDRDDGHCDYSSRTSSTETQGNKETHIRIGQHRLVLVVTQEPDSCLDCISDNECGTSCVEPSDTLIGYRIPDDTDRTHRLRSIEMIREKKRLKSTDNGRRTVLRN